MPIVSANEFKGDPRKAGILQDKNATPETAAGLSPEPDAPYADDVRS